MILTLEVVGPQAVRLGAGRRKVFRSAGGTLGRLPDNDWVLPDPYVSGRHVRIQYASGQFFLEDTSTNGVFINSPDRRLPKGQPHPLRDGERFFIDEYEIRATIAPDEPMIDPFVEAPQAIPAPRPTPPIPDDPFGIGTPILPAGGGEADPLKLLGLEDPPAQPSGPRAADLARGSPIREYFKPPEVVPLPDSAPPPTVQSGLIPDDFDPLAPGQAPTSAVDLPSEALSDPLAAAPAELIIRPTPARPRAPALSPASLQSAVAQPADLAGAPPARKAPRNGPLPPAAARRAPLVDAPDAPIAAAAPAAPTASSPSPPARSTKPAREGAPAIPAELGDSDLRALLVGAGLESGALSPEAAESFGRILRVVVAGLMDVLHARERIKSEFRIQATTFKRADNNPLKFSANVEDALHNLLVKRNPAYLTPVAAFEDAFQDVRNHQMAMLAGVRVAFESMLAQFDPERLQAEFDRQVKKGALLSAPARLRYWELYRDRFRDTVNDADASFRTLFGYEFAKAYEEQLEKLRTLSRQGIDSPSDR